MFDYACTWKAFFRVQQLDINFFRAALDTVKQILLYVACDL
jgi:hypothetical protein